jgi:hypothetical protein
MDATRRTPRGIKMHVMSLGMVVIIGSSGLRETEVPGSRSGSSDGIRP